ncbi:hypothetical protein ACIP5Y_07260 [Nocardia sp. NPDC088792]|uniref:hypothetical protein n=1 Tax=Nocardia sp. NPDC088792 TaxID=3364332 RepID=UPI00381547F0
MIIATWTGATAKTLRKTLNWSQERFAEELAITDRTVRNWERRGHHQILTPHYAHELGDLLDRLSADQLRQFSDAVVDNPSTDRFAVADSSCSGPKLDGRKVVWHPMPGDGSYPEITDMNRRELLRLLSTVTLTLSTPIDWERLHGIDPGDRVTAATAHEYSEINRMLWESYGALRVKAGVFRAAREHLGTLVDALQHPATAAVDRWLRELATDTLQLIGEVYFDADLYSDAANCYTLAASLAAGIDAYDLWACALTRHSYLALYDHECQQAGSQLESAFEIATRGNPELSTRFWVSSVRAQALAGLGDQAGCDRAFDAARGVEHLSASASSVAWMRFSGERIDEEQATCYVQLNQPDAAQAILEPLLQRPLSSRRRASVLVDLAAASAQHRDPVRVVMYGSAAFDIARHSHSAYVARRLSQLAPYLTPLGRDHHIQHLRHNISPLAYAPR